MDQIVTKALSVHVSALLPPTSIELNIAHNTRVAALLGVGLLYQGTGHLHMAEVMLSEIGKLLFVVCFFFFCISFMWLLMMHVYVF